MEATAEREAWAHECLDGLLEVRMQGLTGFNGDELAFPLWDDIEQFRGTEPILLDFMDRPEHLHAIADRLTEVRLAELDILEAKGLLGYGNDRIHCTGAHTTELPKAGFDPATPARDRHLDRAAAASCSCRCATRRSTSSCRRTTRAGTRGSASATSAAAIRSTTGSTPSARSPTSARSR